MFLKTYFPNIIPVKCRNLLLLSHSTFSLSIFLLGWSNCTLLCLCVIKSLFHCILPWKRKYSLSSLHKKKWLFKWRKENCYIFTAVPWAHIWFSNSVKLCQTSKAVFAMQSECCFYKPRSWSVFTTFMLVRGKDMKFIKWLICCHSFQTLSSSALPCDPISNGKW